MKADRLRRQRVKTSVRPKEAFGDGGAEWFAEKAYVRTQPPSRAVTKHRTR
jgi:hypothetical protein